MAETNYFDSSALVKRYLAETGSTWVQTRCNDPTQIIAMAEIGRVEIAAAFASKLRARAITEFDYQRVRTKLATDAQKQYQTDYAYEIRVKEIGRV